MELVKKNFTLVIMAIIVISVLPMVIEFIRARRQAKCVTVAQKAGHPDPADKARR